MEKSRKRSSILKKLSSDDVSPTLPFNRPLRRISFSGKKSVKEFIAVDDKATIWGTSYEESANAEHSSLNNFTLSSVDQGACSVKSLLPVKKYNEPPRSLSDKENMCQNQIESGEADMSIDETIHLENKRTVEPVNPILKLINRERNKEQAMVATRKCDTIKDADNCNYKENATENQRKTIIFDKNEVIEETKKDFKNVLESSSEDAKDVDHCNYKENATGNQRKTIIFDKNEVIEETKKDFKNVLESSSEGAKDAHHCKYKEKSSEDERKTILFHNNIELEKENFDFDEKPKNHSTQTVETKLSINENPQISKFIRRNQKLPIFPSRKISALIARRTDSDSDATQTGANCEQKDSNNERVTMLNDLPQYSETQNGANCDGNQICHNRKTQIFNEDINLDPCLKTGHNNKDMSCCGETSEWASRHTRTFNSDIEQTEREIRANFENALNTLEPVNEPVSESLTSQRTKIFNFKTNYSSLYSKNVSKSKKEVETTDYFKQGTVLKRKINKTIESGHKVVKLFNETGFNFLDIMSDCGQTDIEKSQIDCQIESSEQHKVDLVCKEWIDLSGLQLLGDVSQVENSLDQMRNVVESHQANEAVISESNVCQNEEIPTPNSKFPQLITRDSDNKLPNECTVNTRTAQFANEKLLSSHLSENEVICEEDANVEASGIKTLARDHAIDMKRKTLIFRDNDGDIGADIESLSDNIIYQNKHPAEFLPEKSKRKTRIFSTDNDIDLTTHEDGATDYNREKLKFPQLITRDSDNKLPNECTVNTRTPQFANEVICEEDANVHSNSTCYKSVHEAPGVNTLARDHAIDMKRKTLIFRDNDGDIGADIESLSFPSTKSDNIIYPAEFQPEKSSRKTRIFSTDDNIDLTTHDDGAADRNREPCTPNNNMNHTEIEKPFACGAIPKMINHRKEGRKTVIFHNDNDLEITLSKTVNNFDSPETIRTETIMNASPEAEIEANDNPVQHESSDGVNRIQYLKNRSSNVSKEDYISSKEISDVKERNECNVKINNKRGTIHFKTGKNKGMEVTISGEENEISFPRGSILLPRKMEDQEQTKYFDESNEHSMSNVKIDTEDLSYQGHASKDINMEEKNLSVSFLPKKSPKKTLFLNKSQKPQSNISDLRKDLFNNTINRTTNQSTSPGGLPTIMVTPCTTMSPEAPSSANFKKIPQCSTLLYNEGTPESLRQFNSIYCPDTTEALCNLDPSRLLSRAKRKPSLKKSSTCGRINYSRNSDSNRPTDSHIKNFVDLTCNISTSSSENDIEKTKLDLVETLESTALSDMPYSIAEDSEKIELPYEFDQIHRHERDENVIEERRKTIQNNRGKSFQCGAVVTLMKSDTTSRINVKHEELDFSVYEKFERGPSLDEILSSYIDKLKSNEKCEKSFNETVCFPTVPPVEFLFKNYFQPLEAEFLDSKKALQPKPIHPSIPSFEFLLSNKLKCTNSIWFLNDLYAQMNLLEIRHKRVRTIVLYVHTKTVSGSEGKWIDFEEITIRKCNLYGKRNAYDLILENEVLPIFPSDLLEMCQHSHKNDIFALLQVLDHMSREAIQIVDDFMDIYIETGAYIIKNDKDECFMKKRARNNLWSPPFDIVIHIKDLKNITYRNIVLPETYSITDRACSLPAGLEFLNQFFNNPFSFVKLIN